MSFLEKYLSQRELVKDGKDCQIYKLEKDSKTMKGENVHFVSYTVIFRNKNVGSWENFESALDEWNYLELGI